MYEKNNNLTKLYIVIASPGKHHGSDETQQTVTHRLS